MEPTLRTAKVLKQEAEEIGLQGKDIAEYVREQQALDREERAAWREPQKRQVEIRMAELQAEDKKRAGEIRMAQIETEKELKIKEMELQAQQAQANTSAAITPAPRNKDAKSPKLPFFIDENASWEKDTWAIKLSALLTGRSMDVYTRMSNTDASNYGKLKKALLTRYTEDGCQLCQKLKKRHTSS